MKFVQALRYVGAALLCSACIGSTDYAIAQVSGPASANCHVSDGKFTTCPNGKAEWSDVTPVAFPASDSFLYVNQDATHSFLYLMYDFPVRTSPIAATDSVHVSFYTVEQEAGSPILITYDVYIMGNGQMEILQQGKQTPPGRIQSAIGFGVSPNSSTPHVTAELQVPLSAGPPSTYSPDPLYWSAVLPPTPPPDPCPTDPGKTYNRCVKAELNNAQANAAELSLYLLAAGGVCSTYAVLACGPLEPGLLALGLVWGSFAIEIGRKLGADPPGVNFAVPPDPNYTVIATPAVYTLTLPTTGLTSEEIAAFNAFAVTSQQLIAIEQAATTSLAREEGAVAAGDATWTLNQKEAALTFSAQASALYSVLPTLIANIDTAMEAAGVSYTVTPANIQAVLTQINPTSPTSEVQQQFVKAEALVFQQLGVSAADQALFLPLIQTVDPLVVSTLGTGTVPKGLSDPSIAADFGQLTSGLSVLAPSQATLNNSYTATLNGDYVSGGVGLRGQTSGNLPLTGIPSGATIAKAFLYWGVLDDGEEPSLSQITLNGTPVTGSLIGAGPDTCWGRTNSFTYRAEVSSLVSANGTYALTNVPNGGAILAEGASLVVVYQLPSAPLKTVMIDDGNISIPNGTGTGTAAFTNFTAAGPVTATTSFIVGDGQAAQFNSPTPTTFTGGAGTVNVPNVFSSLDGLYWDDVTVDVSSAIKAGPDTGTATITVSGDCLLWSAQAFSVKSTLAPVPITATAGVVEAGVNGDTVVNLRGLLPTDAPTIQDQVLAIVQFRIINDPSLSPSLLTTQLLSNLVADGIVSPSEASSIEATVKKTLVTTPATPPVPTTVATTTNLSINPNVNLFTGEPITLTAVVVPASGTAIPAGSVTFDDPLVGKIAIPLDKTGTAVYKTVVPAAGNQEVFANYSGAKGFAPSMSSTIMRVVAPAPVATMSTLTINPNANLVTGEPITVTVVVKAVKGTAIPTGSVTIDDPMVGKIAVALDKTGTAVYKTLVPAAGNDSVFANYTGAPGFLASVSNTVTRVVAPKP